MRPRYAIRAVVVGAAMVLVASLLAASPGNLLPAKTDPTPPADGAGTAVAATVTAGSGTVSSNGVASQSPSAAAPTGADLAAAAEATARSPRPGPAPAGVPADTSISPGADAGLQAAAPTDLTVFRSTNVPITAGTTSVVDEPSTDQSGRHIFETGNWHAEYSHNGGVTWTSLNPFSIFGAGFCCDQVTKYDAARNQQFWLLQYGDHETLANSKAADLASWCNYTLTPQMIGQPAGVTFDYNDITVGTKFLYYTTNMFNGSGSWVGTAELRMPIEPMMTCGSLSFDFFVRTDSFTLKVAAGTTDIAYSASSNVGAGTGTSMRLFAWPENSTSLTVYNITIPAFTYQSSGGVCSSADHVVNNWCQRTDSRILGAARANGYLYFSWVAQQSGAGRPFPYTRVEKVRELLTPTLSATQDIFSLSFAIIYTSIAPDNGGHIGWVATAGGGTGTNHRFPGGVVGIVDDVTPNFPGTMFFFPTAGGAGGGCNNSDGTVRWGDYNTARGWPTGNGVWVATTFWRTDNSAVSCGTSANLVVRNLTFGRARSQPEHARWGAS